VASDVIQIQEQLDQVAPNTNGIAPNANGIAPNVTKPESIPL